MLSMKEGRVNEMIAMHWAIGFAACMFCFLLYALGSIARELREHREDQKTAGRNEKINSGL